MMVTFISQCIKRSNFTTRRVLDAFADRIGDNTWQTTITNDGLQVVQTLLRKTATKNTAVSCFWIRSRKQSELLWIVGNKGKFNGAGIVPVNITSKDLIVRDVEYRSEDFKANTNGHNLDDHLFAVGFIARSLVLELTGDKKLSVCAYNAGLLHDIGKIDPEFQKWLTKKKVSDDETFDDGYHIDAPKKFSFENHPRHNEISLILFEYLRDKDDETLNRLQILNISHAIYYHHTIPYRKKPLTSMEDIYKMLSPSSFDIMVQSSKDLLKSVSAIASVYVGGATTMIKPSSASSVDNLGHVESLTLPKFKSYANSNSVDIRKNAKVNIIRSAVVSADRVISSLTASELSEHITEGSLLTLVSGILHTPSSTRLVDGITACLNGFNSRYSGSERNAVQSLTAGKIHEMMSKTSNAVVLGGAAGSGKTKVSLEAALLKGAKKIIWVVPRVQVGQGLYIDLKSDAYLPDVKIEICTGSIRKISEHGIESDTTHDTAFTGDIIITTIDQVLNYVISHSKISALFEMMNTFVVFDEFHEIVNIEGINILFSEIVECKKICEKDSNVLLVSATPEYAFIEKILNISASDVIKLPSFNHQPYKINFVELCDAGNTNPLIDPCGTTDTCIITNEAGVAQNGYIMNIPTGENAVLFHSKFTAEDLIARFDDVYRSFKRDGTKEYDVLRSGPIVQASLNISFRNMITEMTSPANTLQRLGRLNRFGLIDTVSEITIILPNNWEQTKTGSNTARWLQKLCNWNSSRAWIEYLKANLNCDNFTLNDIYDLYFQFYVDEQAMKDIEIDLTLLLGKSIENLNDNIFTPTSSGKKQMIGKVNIKSNSLRGNNRFVQMACVQVDSGKIVFMDEYLYPEDDTDEQGCITLNVANICGYGDSTRSALTYMAQKHHNVKDAYKKSHNDNVILSEARAADKPIYLSYTPRDLERVNELDDRPGFSTYYVYNGDVPLGMMSLEKIEGLFGE